MTLTDLVALTIVALTTLLITARWARAYQAVHSARAEAVNHAAELNMEAIRLQLSGQLEVIREEAIREQARRES